MKKIILYILIITVAIFFIGCVPNIEKMAEKGDVDGLLRVCVKYARSDKAIIASDATQMIIDMGDSAIDELIEAVGQKDIKIAKEAIYILRIMECTDAIPSIMEALENSELESNAVRALAAFGHESTTEILYGYMDIEHYSTTIQKSLINTNINYIQPVTEGIGIDAVYYAPDSPVPHKVIIADEEDVFNPDLIHAGSDDFFREWNKYLPEEWQPLGYPDTVQLVLCWEDIDDKILSSHTFKFNTHKITVRRVLQIKHVILKEAATGKIIADEILIGNKPAEVIVVTEDDKDHDVMGSVTPEMIIEWLRPYIET